MPCHYGGGRVRAARCTWPRLEYARAGGARDLRPERPFGHPSCLIGQHLVQTSRRAATRPDSLTATRYLVLAGPPYVHVGGARRAGGPPRGPRGAQPREEEWTPRG